MELAEDTTSEVFLDMVAGLGALRAEHEAGFYAWLLRIAQAKIARALQRQTRAETRQRPLPDDADSDRLAIPTTDLLSDPAALHELRETVEELGLALGSLTAEQQTVVIGRFLAGQSIEDLARALNKQPGAIRALQFRALGALAERLGQHRTSRAGGKGGRA